MKSWGCLSVLLLGTADGFLYLMTACCVFNSTNPEDVQYIFSHFYNKQELLRFDSNMGWYVGYTDYGVKNAEMWNNDTSEIKFMRQQKHVYCGDNIHKWDDAILDKSVEPYPLLSAAPSGGSERVLICSIYSFFPKDIIVTWTNHQKQITTGVTSTDLLPDSDWTTPPEGALSDGDTKKVPIGGSGLVLSLVLSLAGFLYY